MENRVRKSALAAATVGLVQRIQWRACSTASQATRARGAQLGHDRSTARASPHAPRRGPQARSSIFACASSPSGREGEYPHGERRATLDP